MTYLRGEMELGSIFVLPGPYNCVDGILDRRSVQFSHIHMLYTFDGKDFVLLLQKSLYLFIIFNINSK